MDVQKQMNHFLNELIQFDYELQSRDRIWRLIFPDEKKEWYYVRVVQYTDTYFIDHIDGRTCSLEVLPDKTIKVRQDGFPNSFQEKGIDEWQRLIPCALKWFGVVKKNWIKAYHSLCLSYPMNRRYGILNKALINASLTDIYRLDIELGPEKIKRFIDLLENRYFYDENFTRSTMTANDYFGYCKIAYIAAQCEDEQIDPQLSGCEMYRRYADGRDAGLLEIDPMSQEAFGGWIDGPSMGGHPWEIKRGGNTTHIDLYVVRPRYGKEGFQIMLNGPSIGRLKETINMFLAIQEAGLPIGIHDPEGIRKRLLGMDNVGIVPHYHSLHRANQRFTEEQTVYDAMHYDDLRRYKRRLTPFIVWEALPPWKPSQ